MTELLPEVTLREITADSLRPFLRMKVAPEQEGMVANNAVSIAQAYFEPKAWFRGIYAADEPVGFLMLYDDAEKAEYFLWRLMIAAEHQGKGYGRAAVLALIAYVRGRPGADRLLVSHVPAIPGNPGPFYEKLGFTYTGEKDGIELIMALDLASAAH
jgi:diamine N-acetyltransferase